MHSKKPTFGLAFLFAELLASSLSPVTLQAALRCAPLEKIHPSLPSGASPSISKHELLLKDI
ncbi:hypothetical protein [Janthinobacterium sp. LB2P70]|uniref:hypothetical protein n=1 Tax=Janthinobacterium sp. LB2P70 TaxID=3424197 RepID=UPI003F21B3F0